MESHFFQKIYFIKLTVVNCIYDLKKLGKVHIITLERLHLENNVLMKNFVTNLKLVINRL